MVILLMKQTVYIKTMLGLIMIILKGVVMKEVILVVKV